MKHESDQTNISVQTELLEIVFLHGNQQFDSKQLVDHKKFVSVFIQEKEKNDTNKNQLDMNLESLMSVFYSFFRFEIMWQFPLFL